MTASLFALLVTAPPAGAEIKGIELSFDDGPDGSHDDTCDDPDPVDCYPLRNSASEGSDSMPFDADTGPQLVFTLEGGGGTDRYQ